ncbi:MAG TPA: 30S ribosomal protein S8 [Phycisphaerae bacterium]|nr:30S ribosomal protein S8 [Phycisphaerae bacterium]HOI54055.1 30S ribosomal protein S8 [Phycisphaerae bacterium]
MSMSDPVADMLTRIRNAARVQRISVDIPASKVNRGIAGVLQQEGFILRVEEIADEKQGILRVFLKYGPDGEQVIREIRRVSKPGCRIYRAISDVTPVLDGLGITILSTSKGVVSDRQARRMNVGGELICTVC